MKKILSILLLCFCFSATAQNPTVVCVDPLANNYFALMDTLSDNWNTSYFNPDSDVYNAAFDVYSYGDSIEACTYDFGCTDPSADNYDVLATEDDGSCYFPNLYPIEDPNFLNYLQENYPQIIVNDSLDIDATDGVTQLLLDSLDLISIDGVQFFSDLTSLYCYHNQLTSLPELPQDLTFLKCSHNQLTSLPELPQGLTFLYCYYNQLTSLPELPQSLTYLRCYNNQLTSLPELPQDLTSLHCNTNQLTSLPELPQGLTNLNFGNNQITSLLELPQSLAYLNCGNNQLTSLPVLPQGLTFLDCGNNQLTILPEFQLGLTFLNCDYNQLTSLPELPQSLISLHFNSNPIECVTNYLAEFEQLYDYPLCGESNVEGCTYVEALNYNEEAIIDDSSCIFEFNVSFENVTTITNIVSIYNIYIVNLILGTTQIVIGDLVGVFYLLDGVLVSGGYIVYDGSNNIEIALIGDDPTTPEVEGFTVGQEIIWIVQQVETETNYLIDVETQVDVFTPNTEVIILLEEVNISVTLGCTDPIACNYNPEANLEDGGCKYPVEYIDCYGDCINDIDMDGVCDEVDYDDGIGLVEVDEHGLHLIKMLDVLGREQKEHKKGILLFYIYENGKVKKKVIH